MNASFIEPMLLLRTENLPQGAEWAYQILCGPPHNISSAAVNVMWRWLCYATQPRAIFVEKRYISCNPGSDFPNDKGRYHSGFGR
jgi:hypothetical protein